MAVIVRNGGGSLVGSKSSGMMFTVELPPSKPYTQAAEWIKVTSSVPPFEGSGATHNGFALIAAGNNLLCLPHAASSGGQETSSYAYKINPTTGAYTKTKIGFHHSSISRMCSDGKQFVYHLSIRGLYKIDVINETSSTLVSPVSTFPYTNVNTSYQTQFIPGALAYDDVYKRVYVCGLILSNSQYVGAKTDYLGWYDLNTSTFVSNRAIATNTLPASFAYCDPKDGTLYMLKSNHSIPTTSTTMLSAITNRAYSKFDPSNNTFSHIVSNPTWSGLGTSSVTSNHSPSYVTLGDTGFTFAGNSVYGFDIKTGSAFTSQMPGSPFDTGNVGERYAVMNNTIYNMRPSGFYKCVLYENLPADAPVVCKIYKGQKYHSIEPFNVGSKLSIKRTQQTATSDIEIKMYEYDSGGGQILYIET